MASNGNLVLDSLVAPFQAYVNGTLLPKLRSMISAAKASGKTLNDYFAGR
jgi:hypothetical protein